MFKLLFEAIQPSGHPAQYLKIYIYRNLIRLLIYLRGLNREGKKRQVNQRITLHLSILK